MYMIETYEQVHFSHSEMSPEQDSFDRQDRKTPETATSHFSLKPLNLVNATRPLVGQ
jgi:hypothetical protein